MGKLAFPRAHSIVHESVDRPAKEPLPHPIIWCLPLFRAQVYGIQWGSKDSDEEGQYIESVQGDEEEDIRDDDRNDDHGNRGDDDRHDHRRARLFWCAFIAPPDLSLQCLRIKAMSILPYGSRRPCSGTQQQLLIVRSLRVGLRPIAAAPAMSMDSRDGALCPPGCDECVIIIIPMDGWIDGWIH